MQIVCLQCQEPLTFEFHAPRFCQNCGSPVQTATADSDSVSLAAPPSKSAFETDRLDINQMMMHTVPPTGIADVPSIQPSQPQPTSNGGEVIGPYTTTKFLGAGGMGCVWEAKETITGRRVALKQLSSSMADDSDSLKRFFQEAQLAAKISHPNVTFIYETGQQGRTPYIAMELMPGVTLEDQVNQNHGPLDLTCAIDAMINLIDGVEAVHDKGMVHRDIKPSNCFVDADGTIKIGDFGLSKSVVSENANLTKTGTFMGTPSFASPEQIRGVDVDARSDQYSIGATLFFLLSARTPYVGDATSMMAQIIGDPPPSVRALNANVPRDLDLIIQKSLAKSADDRFGSLMQLKAALLPYASHFDSVAGAGRRVAAYMIDQTLLQIVGMIIGIAVMIAMTVASGGPPEDESQARFQFWMTMGMGAVVWGYYALGEGIFERTLGKWLMGLKLVNFENQKAGLIRTSVRAFFVPSGLGISLIYTWLAFRSGHFMPSNNPADVIIALLVGLSVSAGPVIFCVVTMRRSNRFMGLHGWVSGTRVVRASQVENRLLFPETDTRIKKVKERTFGPYSSSELIGAYENGTVYLAHDSQLNRDVWIVARDTQQEPTVARMSLARHARQRWLAGGECNHAEEVDNCQRWDAFEAVQGMPIQQLISTGRLDQCGSYSRLLKELVQELKLAVEDNLLPDSVQLSQVWVNREGRIKLLECRLVELVPVSDLDSSVCLISGQSQEVNHTPVQQAVELIQQLGDNIQRSRVLPYSLNCFLSGLCRKPLESETLDWAIEELNRLEKNSTQLTWDMRIGILAMTMGVEALVFSMIAAGIILVDFYVAPVMMSMRLFLGVAISLTLPMATAAYFGGGFVFHVMKIRVCRLNGTPASPWVNAVRAGLSWLPILALNGATMLALIFAQAKENEMSLEPGSIEELVIDDQSLALTVALTFLISLASIVVGLGFAIFSPKRGLIDYLLRTRLMPE